MHESWCAVRPIAVMAGTLVYCSDACCVAGVISGGNRGDVFAFSNA